MEWLIYGAYGFSGTLIAEEAVRRGYRPLLAGRSEAKLEKLAGRLGLPYRVFGLDDLTAVTRALHDVELVLHAAGPFAHTSDPMLKACTLAGVNYLDITGEYPALERVFTFDEAARRQGIALIPGVGFDVVPSDCLAVYVAQQLPEAAALEIGIYGLTRMSVGTALSGIGLLGAGGRVRRDGKLAHYPLGAGVKRMRFDNGMQTAMPIPWGDLVTAYRSTGIPNITTYMVFPAWMRLAARFFSALLVVPPLRQLASGVMGAVSSGPDAALQQGGSAHLWARAVTADGRAVEAWLRTAEPYRFTALSALRCVERVRDARPVGALTPAQAFGADLVLEIAGSQRLDTLV